ncbi:uncharacterized protein [Venturia canescens]|uniref:uncharacterized protein n=1 Tax=Venturia canescens TaxID=32260 RepID=UPI001C9D132B|nr:uncharacterized protein LOC122407289 [Venturia canescens]
MKYFAVLLFAIVISCLALSQDAVQNLELQLPNGKIRGSIMTSQLGKDIFSFRALRYGEPPIGQKRFMYSIPVGPWDGVFDASQEGPSCPQPGGRNQSEDCLRLNVYTTKLPTMSEGTEINPQRPVIVYFHGGFLFESSGQSGLLGPQYLLDEEIVLVTANYRLGIFGFLSTADTIGPGNAGLKDQVLVLRWVKKNIDKFGGDPNSVTIAGYGDGAMSVTLHLLSPMSRGLFHRAIGISGSALYQRSLPYHQKDLAVKQAQAFGCPYESSYILVGCLKSKSAIEIGATWNELFKSQSDPVLLWTPVVEPETPGVERFLPAQPAELIARGEVAHVPFITGVFENEFVSQPIAAEKQSVKVNASVFEEFDQNWNHIAPISFFYERDTPRSIKISSALRDLYFEERTINYNSSQILAKLYSDAMVNYAVHNFLKNWCQISTASTYVLNILYPGKYGYRVWSDRQLPSGISHVDHSIYLFWNNATPRFTVNDPEYKMTTLLSAIWSSFAKTGVPIPRDNKGFANVTWAPYTCTNMQYLEVGQELTMHKRFEMLNGMVMWDNLFDYLEYKPKESTKYTIYMNYFAVLLFVIVITCSVSAHRAAKNLELQLPDGKIRGSIITSRLGKDIFSYRALRYAEPPTGERRFKQAVPLAPWDGVFDASQEGPSCPQPGGRNQSEDCLRLNVYTTKLPSRNKGAEVNPKRPVIVYFHPGAFYVFTGQSRTVGPHYLLDQEIVLVTVNYRLGSLGFLSTGDAVAPGNLGLKDQVEALRWVKKNIGKFGGDPNSVTITGYSAGSWSVSLHLLSPMSRGLFHRAIAMSGSAIYQTPLQPHQRNLAVKQAQFLGCPYDTNAKILECLKTKDAIEMGATLSQFFEWHGDPVLVWAPVIEPEVPGVERFLTGQPSDLIKRGEFSHVPLITGICKDEFGGVVVPAVELARKGNTSVFEDLDQHWNHIAPISFFYERGTQRSTDISTALRQFYFKGRAVSLDTVEDLSKIYADALVIFNINNFVKLMGQASRAPVYFYEFTYQGRYSHSVWSDTKKPFGVVHHDDLLYLFWDDYFPYFAVTDPEYETVKTLTGIWANFAKTGEPIPRNNEKFRNVVWTPFTCENNKYLEIGNELVMKTNLYKDRMMKWERLFPLGQCT